MSYTDDELLKLDPELEHIFNTQGWPKTRLPTQENHLLLRNGFNAACAKYNKSVFAQQVLGVAFHSPTWTETDHNVPVRDGTTIKVRSYAPLPTSLEHENLPVIVQIHGGGFLMGDLDTDALICRLFCTRLRVVVLNIHYRRHPEVDFPIPVLDCYDAVRWASTHAPSLGGDPTKGFIISGNSGGGTYAAIVAHLVRDDKLSPKLTGCLLTCPALTDECIDDNGEPSTLFDHETEYRSYWQNADAPFANHELTTAVKRFADFDLRSPLLTPFHFPSHADIPPTYICVCGLDPRRDGGFLYKRELERVGELVKIDVYPGLPHCWWTSHPQISRTQVWLRNTVEGMKWLLSLSHERKLNSKI